VTIGGASLVTRAVALVTIPILCQGGQHFSGGTGLLRFRSHSTGRTTTVRAIPCADLLKNTRTELRPTRGEDPLTDELLIGRY